MLPMEPDNLKQEGVVRSFKSTAIFPPNPKNEVPKPEAIEIDWAFNLQKLENMKIKIYKILVK